MKSNFNRLGNCHNRYQGDDARVLCVCSAGLLRSPTAANVLHEEFGYNTRACGVSEEYALIILDEVLIEWADEIVFMDRDHYQEAKHSYGAMMKDKRIYILGVPDKYEYMNEELKALILKNYNDAHKIAVILEKKEGMGYSDE